ncbi:MAG: GNAT family N-acetyltransferase [Bacteroidota bacterium]
MSISSEILIRSGEERDMDQIQSLLKASLGERLLPKTKDFWIWKHQENPFGRSPVLLAEKDNQIIGLRTFLKWEFQEKGAIFKALRAVDTAIHPSFQGKGLFKKLTLSLLEAEIHHDYVFNTPNQKSLPGYEKMGWNKWGKLPIKVFPVLFQSKNRGLKKNDWNQVRKLINSLETDEKLNEKLQTHLIPGYISWRYEKCPIVNYFFLSDEHSFLLIYRVKQGKSGKELRITDLFCSNSYNSQSRKSLNLELKELIKTAGVSWVSFSGLSPLLHHLNLGLLPIIKIGPMVTLRNLSSSRNLHEENWGWSLGDLELF